MITPQEDTPKRGRPSKPARHRFADSLGSLMEDYETLPNQDRHEVDKAIVQALDISARDWAMAMRYLIDGCKR